MNSNTDLSQYELMFNLIRLANKRLLEKYKLSLSSCPAAKEELKEVLGILDLVVNEIDRLRIEE